LLRLDPGILLIPAETQPAPVELVSPDAPLMALLEQGLTARPELAQHQALVRASLERLRLEKWRPWIPSVALGYSAGGFGGGTGSEFGRFGGRSDFDAVLAWEFRNLGLGNRALQRERSSVLAQANLTAEQTRDNVMAEITRAYHQVRSRREQVDASRRQLAAAAEALPLNFKGIVGGNLRAIEGQQAVQALAAAQAQYLASVIEYNQAQFQLLRAVGRPLDADCKVDASGR
jgi:outer membrane protein TolC